jgi:hypothetical protein
MKHEKTIRDDDTRTSHRTCLESLNASLQIAACSLAGQKAAAYTNGPKTGPKVSETLRKERRRMQLEYTLSSTSPRLVDANDYVNTLARIWNMARGPAASSFLNSAHAMNPKYDTIK